MNFKDYAWDKAIQIALRCLAKGGVTKDLMHKQGKPFANLMIGDYVDRYQDKITEVYDGYGDLIRETCDNEIPIPKSCYKELIAQIEEEFGGLEQYAKFIGLDPKEHLHMIVSDWAWGIENPYCILLKEKFWNDVWKKLPSGKTMSGYKTSIPQYKRITQTKKCSLLPLQKNCPVKVDIRKMF